MRALHLLAFTSLPACAIGFAGGLSGCRSLPPSKPASEWTPKEANGAAVYPMKCASLPLSDYDGVTCTGPGLQAITQAKGYALGSSANRVNV